MKKRIFAFLLAGILTFGSATESICATQTSAGEGTNVVTESTESEDVVDMTGIEEKVGGLQQPEIKEIDLETAPEFYDESVDATGSAVYKTEWDKYSTNYYYNLLPEECKTFWDKADEMCRGYLTGTESVTTVSDGYYFTKGVLGVGLSKYQAINTALMFKYSNPQYYFLDLSIAGSSYGSSYVVYFTVFPKFADGNQRANATKQMKTVIDNWMTQINAQPTAQMKEKKAHDLICDKVIYDPGYEDASIGMNEYNQVAYSVFCTPSTVCAGYSQAMQLLMNGAGIDCAVVTSTVGTSGHEWNIIKLNNTWYTVDLTWDDVDDPEDAAYLNITGNIGYQYFNRSQAQLYNEKIAYNAQMHTPESMWNGYLPELTYDSGATWSNYGTVHTPTGALSAPVISMSGNNVSITAPSGGTIYYTTDGTNPSIASTKAKRYSGSLSVTQSATIKAIAVKNGYYDSSIAQLAATPKFTVTFQANGGYINKKSVKKTTKTVAYGQKIGKLASPKRKGYAFLGWYTKKSGGSQITSSTKVTGKKIYYAHWAKINKKTKASISSVKSTSAGKMVVKVKNAKTVSGYQIRYSLKQNMSSAKKKTITGTSLTVKKLKKGKKYYVQVRMYQKDSVSGKKTYGPWSKSKTVKIKK